MACREVLEGGTAPPPTSFSRAPETDGWQQHLWGDLTPNTSYVAGTARGGDPGSATQSAPSS